MSDYFYLKGSEKTLQEWHSWLDKNRGDRARLRRAEHPEDILLTEAFFHFLSFFKENKTWQDNLLASATVAGALSHIKTNKDTASFAKQLATPLEGKGKAPMSELRFQQLQKSETPEDFYRRVIRAIHLLGDNANLVSLANDILHWYQEFERPLNRKPTERLAVRWATDYFTALPKD